MPSNGLEQLIGPTHFVGGVCAGKWRASSLSVIRSETTTVVYGLLTYHHHVPLISSCLSCWTR